MSESDPLINVSRFLSSEEYCELYRLMDIGSFGH